jgi:hypothetical protein
VKTAVLLIDRDGAKEFVADCHVHGVRDGRLLLATGKPGGGLDASITREVDLADVVYVETVGQEDEMSEEAPSASWYMEWGSGDDLPR